MSTHNTSDMKVAFRIFHAEGELHVEVTVDSDKPIAAQFDQSFQEESDFCEAVLRIEGGVASLEDLKLVGSRLWASLSTEDIVGPVRKRIRELRQAQRDDGTRLSFTLDIPPGLDGLPWETLYDLRGSTFLACDPRTSLIRSSKTEAPAIGPRDIKQLRVLVVIPEGSGLRVEHEWDRINYALQSISELLEGGKAKVFHGRVTPDALAKEVRHGYDIVHFIGHGVTSEEGVASIRLNAEDGTDAWTLADAFVSIFSTANVGLVFLNCCLSGQPSTRAGFAGLGPMLVSSGVPAVVAMRYEVPDEVAIKFATVFYQELVAGPSAGYVEMALQSAREALLRNLGARSARAVATPLCFVANLRERLFTLAKPSIRSSGPTSRRSPQAGAPVPDALVAAIRDGRCIPVLGPGLLAQTRSAPASSVSIPLLARRLAEQSNYPEMDELALAERAGEWLNMLVFQRICQHFEQERERYELTSAVLSAHEARKASSFVHQSIAQWEKLPGLICTYFDGLTELAFEKRGRRFTVAHSIDDKGDGQSDSPLSLVVCLRGSIWNADSLVLTMQDHDTLWERMAKPIPEVGSLVTAKLGRCLLFLGVSPRDIWARRFIRHLLPPSARNVGPAFFVGDRVASVDKASWQGLKEKWTLHWIEDDVENFVDKLTTRVVEGQAP